MFENFLKNNKIENAVLAVKNDPDNVIKLDILGRIYFENNFYNKGIEVFEKIISLNPKYLPALDLLSKGYLKTKQYLKAYNTLKTLYSYTPDDFKVRTMLLNLKDIDAEMEEQIEIIKGLSELFDEIGLKEQLSKLYLDNGQFRKAATLLEELYEKNNNPEYLKNLSNIYIKLKNYQKAISSLEELMQSDCFKPQDANILAELYIKENRFDEAREIFELLSQTYPDKAEIFKEKIAKILLNEKNPDKAIEITNSVIENNIYSVKSKFLQAQALIDKKEYKKAVEFLRDFICDPVDKKTEQQIQDKIIETSILYSQSLRENKKYQEAIDALIPALRYDEKNKNVYIELSRISTEIRDYSSAKEYMKIAEEL